MEAEKKGDAGRHSHHHTKKISTKLNLGNIFIGLAVALGIIIIFNIFLTFSLNSDFKKASADIKEKMKPANIELTLIRNSKCSDCSDASEVVNYIKGWNANISKESAFELDSKQGKDAISKYQIQKIPSVVITGEIDKVNPEGFEKKENALVLSDIQPPYTNAATGKIEGRVFMLILKDKACDKCHDFSGLINEMKRAGIKITEERIIDSGSSEGVSLIKKYSIGFVPAIIVSKEASSYPIMQQAWPRMGTVESDGSYVLRLVSPPYMNLTTGRLRGIVDAVYLTDKSCTDCYDVNLNRQILANQQGIGMKFEKEDRIDVSDEKGKELIKKYNITQAPTVILSEEASAYPSMPSLSQFFSAENDGSYVFRKPQIFGAYRDLATGQVIKAPK